MACDTLPPLIDTDITGRHGRRWLGIFGPGRLDVSQWQNNFLRYGARRAKSREANGRKIAINVVN